MSSHTCKKTQTRRAFFSDVTASTALAAAAMAQLGSPKVIRAQEKKNPVEGFGGKSLPPWPKGTAGNKYSHLFCTKRIRAQSDGY